MEKKVCDVCDCLKLKRKVIFSDIVINLCTFRARFFVQCISFALVHSSLPSVPLSLSLRPLSNHEKLVCFRCTCIRFQQIIHVLHSTSA